MRKGRGSAALVVAGVVVALAFAPISSGSTGRSAGAVPAPGGSAAATAGAATAGSGWDGTVSLVDDGSGADTGPQPAQPPVEKLKPGQKPPQFVVFSWDGAPENDSHLLASLRALAGRDNARMTFFLRGIDLLPSEKQSLYQPSPHNPGTAVRLPTADQVQATLAQLGKAWLDGDEIATGFNGAFCGSQGAGAWTTADWANEIDQASSFVRFWKTDTGLTDLPPLPFDYQYELVGGRAPCQEGAANRHAAEQSFGWRYDASSPGGAPAWPDQQDGIWNFPLQHLPYPGRASGVLSTDSDFLAVQSAGRSEGDPSAYPAWEQQTRDAYLAAFQHAYDGDRAPLFIGTHLEEWNGGSYVHAAEDVMSAVCRREGVRCVSYRQLADWLDAQDPAVLSHLRAEGAGSAGGTRDV